MINQSYHNIKDAILTQQTTCESLVLNYINVIKAKANLNAFLEIFEEEAIQRAQATDEKIKMGKAGKLAGLVIGIKDNICYKDHEVSAASKILKGFKSIYSATVVERLLAEDAIIIGRLNCDEFAMGGSNENSAFGNVLNPLDNSRVPGGSSGGSAAAVAAGMCMATLGTDTGGSIRQPSSFCGIVGVKPTYGRVSRYGAVAFASSFDQIGPIANSVEDCALILEVLAGSDNYDTTASTKPVPSYSSLFNDSKKYKIAVISDSIDNEGIDAEVKAGVLNTIEQLKENGHTVEIIDFHILKYLIPTYYVITTAEASSNLARYDGVHFGYRSPNATDLDSNYKLSRSEGFGKEVKRRIMLGTFVLSSGYYDAYYSKAQKVRRLILEQTNEIFKTFDFILTPTTPGTAFKIGEKSKDPIKMYLEDIYTVHANLAGIPAISLPMGMHSNGMPMGVQLMAKQFNEENLFNISKQLLQYKHA